MNWEKLAQCFWAPIAVECYQSRSGYVADLINFHVEPWSKLLGQYTDLQIYYGLLLKEHLPRTQESLERDCLEHNSERSLKGLWLVKYSNEFVFIDRRSWNSKCPGLCVVYVGIWLASLVHWHSHAPSPILLKVCRNFKEGLHCDLFK